MPRYHSGASWLAKLADKAARDEERRRDRQRWAVVYDELQLKRDGISATVREIDGEFTVLEGSGARMAWIGVEHAYKVLHEELVREGAIVPSPDGRTRRFARD